MSRKITWKKGMRLSPEVFIAADNAYEDTLHMAALLTSAGRLGLFTTYKPFELSVNINNNTLEVTSLSCHGVTRSGKIVDIEFDSNYSNTFDTRITIPAHHESDAYLLVVKMYAREWREVDEMYSESKYTFELLGVNSKIDDDSLPIGCIVNQYGWRLNEIDFVPPCLYLSAHPMYMNQLGRIQSLAKDIWVKCIQADRCEARILLSEVCLAISRVAIRLDKERDTLTPNQLYAEVQNFVSAFVLGCRLDCHINLENQEPFLQYMQKPYDLRNVYKDIEQGCELLCMIAQKMETVFKMVEEVPVVVEEKKVVKEPELPKPRKNRKEI